MSLLQNLVKTYDFVSSLDKSKKREIGADTIAPLYHANAGIDIQICLDRDGNKTGDIVDFVKKDKPAGSIPVTEKSLSRTSSTVAPHALIDNAKNLALKQENIDAYLSNLKDWLNFDPTNDVLNAVYSYMSKGTLKKDLDELKAIKDKESGKKQTYTYDNKCIGWVVEIDGENIESWASPELVKSYTAFMKSKKTEKSGYCMITGKDNVPLATTTGKISGNAKLISSNDLDDYTYRGRFKIADEAMSIESTTAQKAINALTWLYNSDKYSIQCGNTAKLICWSPSGIITSLAVPFLDDCIIETANFPSYKVALENYIKGKISDAEASAEPVVVAIFEAATTGRLSVKFYCETTYKDYLASLKDWALECCWLENNKISTPNLRTIIKYAFGLFNPSDRDFTVNWQSNAIAARYYAELFERRIINGRIPEAVVNNLVERCNKLDIYISHEFNKNYGTDNNLLYTTCAVLRKYHLNRSGKDYSMSLNTNETDRSYLYGRLLAVLEKIELDAVTDITKGKSTTNASRMLSMYTHRPAYTAAIILEKLKTAYYPRFSGWQKFILDEHEKRIIEIMDKIGDIPPEERNRPLKNSWIIGYCSQMKNLRDKTNNN